MQIIQQKWDSKSTSALRLNWSKKALQQDLINLFPFLWSVILENNKLKVPINILLWVSTLPVIVCCTSGVKSLPGSSSKPILTSTQARFTSKQQNFGGPAISQPYKSSRQALRTRIDPICLGVNLACTIGLSISHKLPTTAFSSSLSTATPAGGRNCANWPHMPNLVSSVDSQKSLESLTSSERSSGVCLLHALSLFLPERSEPSKVSPFSWLRVWFSSTAWHKAEMAPLLRSCSGPLGKAHTTVKTR